eukprot:SAG31_NODE_11912_length_986_cov_172.542277_1_plen_81_part_00
MMNFGGMIGPLVAAIGIGKVGFAATVAALGLLQVICAVALGAVYAGVRHWCPNAGPSTEHLRTSNLSHKYQVLNAEQDAE